ncbi:2-hydroxymuconate tautomerase [Xylophilus sp. ASV27]|uniref:2-hydroxymuconate tautomerase n=1 Tax=Xylophilus sp. ASV27 TaxID=2795129 RepID=UPI001E43716B|nr:2-hydroxymuconate tautomerase [Xylophilus sp. ASV27]
MPLIQVTMIEGRSADVKTALIQKLTQAAIDATGAPRETIRVILQEVPGAHWGVGGIPKSAPAKGTHHV